MCVALRVTDRTLSTTMPQYWRRPHTHTHAHTNNTGICGASLIYERRFRRQILCNKSRSGSSLLYRKYANYLICPPLLYFILFYLTAVNNVRLRIHWLKIYNLNLHLTVLWPRGSNSLHTRYVYVIFVTSPLNSKWKLLDIISYAVCFI